MSSSSMTCGQLQGYEQSNHEQEDIDNELQKLGQGLRCSPKIHITNSTPMVPIHCSPLVCLWMFVQYVRHQTIWIFVSFLFIVVYNMCSMPMHNVLCMYIWMYVCMKCVRRAWIRSAIGRSEWGCACYLCKDPNLINEADKKGFQALRGTVRGGYLQVDK